jgi:metal-responsive CopG/Arc/MetJ family transcriptional regulator
MSVRLTISIEEELLQEIKRLAKKEGKSVSEFVRSSLREWLMDRKRRHAGMKLLEFVGSVSEDALKELEAERRRADRDWS